VEAQKVTPTRLRLKAARVLFALGCCVAAYVYGNLWLVAIGMLPYVLAAIFAGAALTVTGGSRTLTKPAPTPPRALEIILGILLALIATGITLAGLWHASEVVRGASPPHVAIVAVLFVAVGGVACLMGFRLVRGQGRGNTNGLLSPVGWKIAGFTFLAIGGLLVIQLVRYGRWAGLIAPAFSILSASWCFSASRQVRCSESPRDAISNSPAPPDGGGERAA
jgi:hypothetical protein